VAAVGVVRTVQVAGEGADEALLVKISGKD